MQKGDLLGKILDEVCPICDWKEAGRNFGVLNARIAQINAAIVLATIAIYGAFAFACGGHIAHVMRQHMRKSTMVIQSEKYFSFADNNFRYISSNSNNAVRVASILQGCSNVGSSSRNFSLLA
ncbi:hypothetical protein PRIPAC_81527 [Pristionchus pacificus]|uniref:Uncharacterized protein n=1 Tax=Pristionchus pacificus TaxID=54126 RepID=A0A2A6CKU4_PRIPA|nr:hypothetical protein PRIPAC_81527 [Pristionchus pacificus]|eukprot:PDM78697.1 hypothetical protein PRIPAC_31276 [Pristionchus pacificus]